MKKNIHVPVSICALLFFTAPAPAQRPSLSPVRTWAYQLQDIDAGQIATNQSFQLIVMDYASDGTDDTKFTASEIRDIRESGKVAIAYFSIGEAEDYRFYWKPEWNTSPPAWLGPENPDWEGNYKVRYWDPDWQRIVFDYLDIVIAQGFDGIYLDIIDGFWYWMHENPEQPAADTLMLSFISALRSYADAHAAGTFYIIPQNPDDILHSTNVTDAMRNTLYDDIDAIGVEDIFFPGDLEEDNPFDPATDRLSNVREMRAAGTPVLSVEYLTQQDKKTHFAAEAQKEGFVPYVCTRELNSLCSGIPTAITNTPPTAPDIVDVSIAPHPLAAAGQLRITCGNTVALSIEMIDMLGRTVANVHAGTLTEGLHFLPVSTRSLPAGVYSLLLRTPSGARQYPVVVLR